MRIRESFREAQEVEDFVYRGLDGGDYEQGRLEDMEKTIENVRSAFARLCDVLADNGVLTAVEVKLVVGGWWDEDIKFVREEAK